MEEEAAGCPALCEVPFFLGYKLHNPSRPLRDGHFLARIDGV